MKLGTQKIKPIRNRCSGALDESEILICDQLDPSKDSELIPYMETEQKP